MNEVLDLLKDSDIPIPGKNSTYVNSNGVPVPRVTEIISSMIHSDTLMYWANNLGFKKQRYRDVLNQAAESGSMAHACIEKFLKEKFETESNIPFLGFKMWYDIVTKDRGLFINTIYSEHKLVCDWFGGTLDALMNIGNRLYLVDFKTSNHVTYKYFLQLAAYMFMLKVVEGINIDGVVVLQLDKEYVGFNEYLLMFNNPEHLKFMNQCLNTFLSLVYAYYNVRYTEEMYKIIF